MNNIFDFFISHDESTIYKKNNHSSKMFLELLGNVNIYAKYMKIIDGTFFISPMRKHICQGFELEKDGSYKMQFLHGYRLDLLDTYSLDHISAGQILHQCEILLKDLAQSNENGDFFGDWAMHNLVYSLELKSILNIDLEGFLTYHPVPEWADFGVVEGWIKDTISHLQSIISELK